MANPFDQFATATANPFDAFDMPESAAPEEGALAAIGRQLKAGAVVELPQMLGQAAQYVTEPGSKIYEAGKGVADAATARGKLPENAPIDESKHNTVTNALAGGARMIPQSVAPALAVGGALALAPEALTGGALLGIAGAAGAVPAALSQGQQTLEKLRESGVSEEEARKAARINAGIEFAGETAANYVGGKVLGVGAKALKGKTAADVVENAAAPSTIKPWLKATGEAAVVEPATEFGQNYGETAVENAYGAKNNPEAWDAGVGSIAPTLGMTALLAPFGLVGHGMNAARSLKRTQALENPETDSDARLAIANELHQQLKDIDLAAADHFLNNVLPAIENNQPIKIDQSVILPPDVTSMDQANSTLGHAVDQYGQIPGQQAQLGYQPSVIEVPTQDGGTTTIDRNAGAISAAVVDTGAGDMLRTGSLIRSYKTQDEAANELAQRPDAERMTVASHPRDKSRFAVVPKSAQELAAIDAKAAATAQNEARAVQVQAEEDARQADKDVQATQKRVADLHRSAAAIEKSIGDDTPAGDAAIAREHASELRAQAKELQSKLAKPAQAPKQEAVPDTAEVAQEELAPAPVQPVSELPGVQRMQQNRLAKARAEAEARGAQLADDEANNTNQTPTEAQIAAGNYQKGHVRVGPLDISIENPAGSTRSGTENGKKWSTKMKDHYGYMKRTTGADGDQVDVYIKRGTPTDHTGPVYVVDQLNPKTGQFDEHKAMVGYGSLAEAQQAYDAHFSDKSGPARRSAITEMTPSAFKDWAKNGDTSQPIVQQDTAQEEIAQSTGAKFAPKRGETQEQYHARRAAEVNAKRTAQQASTEGNVVADVREALGDPTAEVSTVELKDLPNADVAEKGQVSRQAAGFMANVARMFGKKIVYVSSMPADGFYLRGNTIYLSTTSSVHHLRLMGHELLHALRNQAPKAYDRMLEAVGSLATEAELRAQVRDYYADKASWTDAQVDAWLTETGNKDMITEEWLADLSGNRFAESSFWESAFSKIEEQHGSETAKGVIAQLKMALTNALNKLLSLVRGNKFAVDARLADQLDEIREALASGFADYAKAVKDNQAVDQRQGLAKFAKGSDNGHKRTKDGVYVGAPAGMTSAKLGALRTRLKALAKEGEPGRFWHEDSSQLILAAAEGDKGLAEKVAGLLAIYSPQATVSANTSMGLKALYQWMNGDPIKARFGAQDKKAQAWMDGTIGEKDALQIKTGNFFKNLMRKIDEDRYGFEKQGATIDMWMARVFGYGSKAIGSEARYLFAEREVTKLADELGWEPQQVQAALWVAIKSRIEAIAGQAREIGQKNGWLERKVTKVGGKENISWPPKDAESREQYEALILKMALATEADPSGLTKAAYHFGTALRERVGQISWEAMPGKTTGVLPGIFAAPLEQQTEYLVAMDKALRDENGQDLIAKKLGLPVIGTAMGPSAWQMNVGAGAQTEVAISTERDQGNKKISVSAPARNLLNTYAAIRGYVLSQEAVVWHYPIFDASKKNANGVQLDFGRDPTHDEVVSLYNAINAVSGRDDWAPAYVPGVGVRILNFSEVANPEFHKLVKKALVDSTFDFGEVGFSTFQSDGEYISNDWEKNRDGEDYRQRISGSGRPDLQGWVESELHPRAERINQEFAEKYGWGQAKLSTQRSNAVRNERDGSSNARAGEEVRGYGTAAPGAVTVQGTHYSQQERASLDGRYYGTGMRGAEGPRVRAAADPRLKERVYFYVDKGTGLRPEDGVGAIAHTTQLNNVYDTNADSWLQAKVGRDVAGDAWLSAFESAVIDNGFDGYVTDFGTQRAAVLLGRHSVPVTRGQGGISEAKQAPTTPVTDRVAADRKLPSGRMTGAEWKQQIPEATMLEDDKSYYKDDVVGLLHQAKLSLPRDPTENPDIRQSLKRRINETLAKVDHAVDGLSNLPNTFDYLKGRYLALGKIARVDEISSEVRKAFDHASPTDKKAVYDYLTTRGATTTRITDPALKSIAKRIKDTINYTGDQLVARGLLDQQVRDQYKDQYLPRMYLRHMLDDDAVKAIGMGKKPSDLGYLKHRKDIPVEIRELVLGEIKDPAFLSVNAIGRAMRDVSLMDWMGKISQNNDWVFPEVFTQWKGRRVTAYWLRAEAERIERQAEHYEAANKAKALVMVADMRSKANHTLGAMSSVDHKAYKQIPDTMRYGMLRGMWVRNEIYHDIMGASQIVNADPTWFEDWFGFGGKGTKLTQWWKFTKVALNPPGQIRNFMSNMVMLQLSGVGLHKLPMRLIEAARDISSNGPYWKIAKKYGVTESTFTAQEMFRVKRDLLDMEAQMSKTNPLRFLMSAGARFLEKVSDLYQFSEALGKTIKIIDEMKAGKSEAEAAIEAQKWLFDYSLVPQSVRIARNAPVGLPFLTYQVKVLPRLLEVAAKYPWRFLPWVGLLYGMQAAVASMFGVDDDELKKLKKSLPEWLQDRSHTVFLPMRDADGRLQVADVGYFFPWTFYSQIGMHAADGKVKKALVDDMGGMFSAPIIGAASALMTNYDTFTHKPIYNETDPVGYQAAAIANYAYDLMAPPFLSSHGVVSPMGLADKKFGGKLVQAETGTTNKFGDPKATEAQAIGALVGFNFYGMDPEHTRITNMQVMNMKVHDAERVLRQRLMDRSLSQGERNEVMQSYQAKMLDLQKELVEYAKQSEVPQQLRVLKRQ